jgi:hypothetical protein
VSGLNIATICCSTAAGSKSPTATTVSFSGAIPGVPELREAGARGLLDDLDQADGNAFRQERVAEHELELRDERAETHVVAGAFLAEDDAALLVDLRVEQQQAAGVVGQHLQALGDVFRVGVGQLQHILGAVETGGGIGVAAETHAHALEKLDERAGRVVLAAVEGHVLEEVRDAALILLLMERTRLDEQAERGAALRLLVGIDHVAHAVGQGAEARRRVSREVAAGLGKTGSRRQRGEDERRRQEERGEFHRGRLSLTGRARCAYGPCVLSGPVGQVS